MPDEFELSRRKALAALGTVGAASAGAGLGTSAFFSDQETFENNQLTAGTLDMKVGWEEHYSDWSEDEAEHAHMEDGELVVDDREGFMDATLQERFPDKRPPAPLCEALADVPDDLERPVIELEDVKPGDFGEVTFTFALCDNPGYVWMNGELLSNAENGVTEPEADSQTESEDGVGPQRLPGNLPDSIRVTLWYDDCDNFLDGTESVFFRGSLAEALALLSQGRGLRLDGGTGDSDAVGHFDSEARHCLGLHWIVPPDAGNALQSDSVRFDLGFYTEQWRHNEPGQAFLGDEICFNTLVVQNVSYSGDDIGTEWNVYGAVNGGWWHLDNPVAVGPPDDTVGFNERVKYWFDSCEPRDIDVLTFAEEDDTGGNDDDDAENDHEELLISPFGSIPAPRVDKVSDMECASIEEGTTIRILRPTFVIDATTGGDTAELEVELRLQRQCGEHGDFDV